MTVIRTLAALLAGLVLTAATLGFVVHRSLADTAGFTARMDEALSTPEVQSEITTAIRTEVNRVGEQVAQSAGPLGDLARSGASAIAERAGQVAQSARFRAAWSQWGSLLYSGLTDVAQGAPSDTVSVSGSDITVAVGPLIEPLVGDTLTGGVTGVLTVIGQGTTVTLATGIPVQQALSVAGTTATYRWGLLVTALLLLCVVVVPAGRRWLWAGWAALWCAACAGLLTLLTVRAPDAPTGDYPALSAAIVGAVTQPWVQPLATVTVTLAVAGVLALIVGAARRPRARGAG